MMSINKNQNHQNSAILKNQKQEIIQKKNQSIRTIVSNPNYQDEQIQSNKNSININHKKAVQIDEQIKLQTPIKNSQNKIEKNLKKIQNISQPNTNVKPQESDNQKQQPGRIIKNYSQNMPLNLKKEQSSQKKNTSQVSIIQSSQKNNINMTNEQVEIIPLTIQKKPKYRIGDSRRKSNSVASKVLNISLSNNKKDENQNFKQRSSIKKQKDKKLEDTLRLSQQLQEVKQVYKQLNLIKRKKQSKAESTSQKKGIPQESIYDYWIRVGSKNTEMAIAFQQFQSQQKQTSQLQQAKIEKIILRNESPSKIQVSCQTGNQLTVSLIKKKSSIIEEPKSTNRAIQSENLNIKVKLKNMKFPNLPQLPLNKNPKQLLEAGRKIFQLFNVCTPDQKMHISTEKYRNCVHFVAKNIHILWYDTGRFYIGEYKLVGEHQGHKHGYGIEFLPEKSVYEGEFKNNKKFGFGTLKFINGDYYRGSFVQGLQKGKGKFYQNNNLVYDGEWKDGQMQGYGKLILKNSNIYEGLIVKGLQNGYGTLHFANGDLYKGHFFQGKFNGLGTYKWHNGQIYEGQFLNGCRHGTGIWKSKTVNGTYDQYHGEYRNDIKSGMGKYIWELGKAFYEGEFQNDQRHGVGIMKQQNGKLIRALWKNGTVKKILYQESPVTPRPLNSINQSQQNEKVINSQRKSIYGWNQKMNNQSIYQKLVNSPQHKSMMLQSKSHNKASKILSNTQNDRWMSAPKEQPYSTIQYSGKLNKLYS